MTLEPGVLINVVLLNCFFEVRNSDVTVEDICLEIPRCFSNHPHNSILEALYGFLTSIFPQYPKVGFRSIKLVVGFPSKQDAFESG